MALKAVSFAGVGYKQITTSDGEREGEGEEDSGREWGG